MNLETGDIVAFLNETGEGKVLELKGKGHAVVLTEDGFEVTYPIEELVPRPRDTNLDKVYSVDDETRKRITLEDLYTGREKSVTSKSSKDNRVLEVDLHIEELMDRVAHAHPYRIVQTQLTHCEKAIEKAIQERIPRLVLIHGVGEGVLKEEVRRLLHQYPQLEYYDAPYDRYGFGATEVIVRYS